MPVGEMNPWDLAQTHLKQILDEHSYKNWFAQTCFESFTDGCLVVSVPSQFFADWLKDHYLEAISQSVKEVIPSFREVRFVPNLEAGRSASSAQVAPATPLSPVRNRRRAQSVVQKFNGFNPRYTFDRFVIGASNRFAHAAAKAVAESPARAYNPLFLYGSTGLGKTHLMQAIGQEILEANPGAKVMFISSEQFTNQMIESIAKKSTQQFRAKYRKVDVLLIDDVHFLSGKEATQEEFFHTFNALFDMHKQIVISSDRSPKEIDGIEDRLISRFEWGLVTDIQPPDIETRIAILQNKASEENFTVEADVNKYIATHITSNIRELEGALITVMAYSKLTEQPISIPMVEEVLRDLIGREKIRPATIDGVQRAVAEFFDVRISDLRGRSRQRQVAFPRQIAMFLCKNLIPSLSLNEVGEAFGGKDHTTVLYACQKINNAMKDNRSTHRTVEDLKRAIRA